MTLILGLNFSHKLHLAGDTRVTRHISDSEDLYIDNILKEALLWGKQNTNQKFFNEDTISLAVAGNVAFATYLFETIQNGLNERMLDSDIRKFDEQILEFIQKASDEWMRGNEYQSCALIFSGMTPNRRKKISEEKLLCLKKIFGENVVNNQKTRNHLLKEIVPHDETWKVLESKLREATGKSVADLLKEGDAPVVSSWIQDAISKGTNEIEMPDSLIIGIEIIPNRGILRKETAEWGELIAYGAGLSKSDIPQSLIATLELSHIKSNEQNPQLMEAAIISNTILDIANERKIGTIGGSVILLSTISDGSVLIQTEGLENQADGSLTMRVHNYVVPITPFYILAKKHDSKENLEMEY